MKQYIEHDGVKSSFVIKQVERRSFQEIDKAEETDSNIDCPSLIKDELKEFRIRKAQKTKILHHLSQNTPDAAWTPLMLITRFIIEIIGEDFNPC